ncbi:hypothetical protein D3C80_2096050 [compost metagenome]
MDHQGLVPIQVCLSPDSLIDLLFGHDLTQMTNKVLKDMELLARKHDFLTRVLIEDPVFFFIDKQMAKLKWFR